MKDDGVAVGPAMGSFGNPNLVCTVCGQAFYSEAAEDMAGRPCPQPACTGLLGTQGQDPQLRVVE